MAQTAANKCEICQRGPGKQYCIECDQKFCEDCKALHLRSKISRNHTFNDSSDIKDVIKSTCKEHNENLLFLCLHCDVVICRTCITGSHNGHKVSGIEESISKMKTEVDKTIKNKSTLLHKHVSKTAAAIKTVEQDEILAIAQANDDGNKIKELIDEHVKTIINTIKEKTKIQMDALKTVDADLVKRKESLVGLKQKKEELEKVNGIATMIDELKMLMITVEPELVLPSINLTAIKYKTCDTAPSDIAKLLGTVSEKSKQEEEKEVPKQPESKEQEANEVQKQAGSEKAIVSVNAGVMSFDNGKERWTPACKTSLKLSKVQIFHHSTNNTFRVVGWILSDRKVVTINSAIVRPVMYEQATPTFHQFRDCNSQIYGLNFANKEDADKFAVGWQKMIDTLKG